MPRPKTDRSLELNLTAAVANAAVEIVAAVRADMAAQLAALIGALAPAPKRKPGRPAKVASPTLPLPPPKAAKAPKPVKAKKAPKRAPKAGGGRRSFDQVSADDDKLLAFVKANPGLRSEDILKKIGMPKQHVASGLKTLRESGKLKMQGVKRGATYTAA